MRVFSGVAAAAIGCTALMTALAPIAGADSGNGGRNPSGNVRLDGRQVVDGQGSRNGSGRLRWEIRGDRFCYTLTVRNLDRPDSAHINFGPRGQNGPVAVRLRTPDRRGTSSDCIRAREDQNRRNYRRVLTRWELEGIKEDPWFFYVQVDSRHRNGNNNERGGGDDRRGGSIRGQLSDSDRRDEGHDNNNGGFGGNGNNNGNNDRRDDDERRDDDDRRDADDRQNAQQWMATDEAESMEGMDDADEQDEMEAPEE